MIEDFTNEIAELKIWVPDTQGSNGVMPILTADQHRFARAVALAEKINRYVKAFSPVAWRTRDLVGDGWVVFATHEKGMAWIKANAPARSHNALQALYARGL